MFYWNHFIVTQLLSAGKVKGNELLDKRSETNVSNIKFVADTAEP